MRHSYTRTIILSSVVLASLTIVSTVLAADGNYKEIACTQDYFKTNSCTQCFEGGSLDVGKKLTNLYDMWTNTLSGNALVYQSNQIFPTIVNLGGESTSFTQTPGDAKTFWKYGPDILWTQSVEKPGDKEFELTPAKSVRFFESDMGAFISLDRTSVPTDNPVGMLKFPLVYSPILADGNEGPQATIVECVAYMAGTTPEVVSPVAETPAPVPLPKPKPKELVTPKTGTEENLLIVVTIVLTTGIFYVIRRRRQA